MYSLRPPTYEDLGMNQTPGYISKSFAERSEPWYEEALQSRLRTPFREPLEIPRLDFEAEKQPCNYSMNEMIELAYALFGRPLTDFSILYRRGSRGTHVPMDRRTYQILCDWMEQVPELKRLLDSENKKWFKKWSSKFHVGPSPYQTIYMNALRSLVPNDPIALNRFLCQDSCIVPILSPEDMTFIPLGTNEEQIFEIACYFGPFFVIDGKRLVVSRDPERHDFKQRLKPLLDFKLSTQGLYKPTLQEIEAIALTPRDSRRPERDLYRRAWELGLEEELGLTEDYTSQEFSDFIR